MTNDMQIPVFHFSTVESTNDLARELLVNEPIVAVVADEQTQGRGRHGKQWIGERGENLYCSIGILQNRALTPIESASYQAKGAIAVAETLRGIAPHIKFCLKYPNDIVVKGSDGVVRKISGILVEHDYIGSIVQHTIIGIGINNAQTEFPGLAQDVVTSLGLLGVEIPNWELMEILQRNIVKRLKTHNIIEEWRRELNIEGKRLTLHGGKEAFTVRGVLDDGTLLADTGGGNVIIYTGDSFRYDIDCGQKGVSL